MSDPKSDKPQGTADAKPEGKRAGRETAAAKAARAGEAAALAEPPELEGGGFDRVVDQLRGVVEKLESGSLSLEESLSVFEEGVRLSRAGSRILDRAEQRVEILTRAPAGSDGDERAVPFHLGPSEGGDEG